MPWQKQYMDRFLRSLSLLLILFMISGCGGVFRDAQPEAGVPEADSSSISSLMQGLKYIRENPSQREDELVQRYLWLDQWIYILQEKGKLNGELGQEFWEDLDSFSKNEGMTLSGLEKIRARTRSRLGKNVVLYELYLQVLKEASIQEAMRYLEFAEEDGITNIFVRSQELLQLQEVKEQAESRKIGVLLPLTGANQDLAEEILLAVQIVSDSAMAEGVEFIVQDIGETEDSLIQAFNRLAIDFSVTTIIGPLTNSNSKIIFERAEVVKVPVISLAPRESLDLFGRYSFRSTFKIEDQLTAAARFIREDLGARRVGVLIPDSRYGFDVIDQLRPIMSRYSLDITELQIYGKDATDFKAPLEKMTRLNFPKVRKGEICSKGDAKPERCVASLNDLKPILNFEAILMPDFSKNAGQFLTHLPFLKIYGAQVVGLAGFNSPILLDRGGSAAEGVVFVDGYFPTNPDFQTKVFIDKFKAVAGREPTRLAAEGFDVALMTLNIFQKTLGPVSRESFADDFGRISDFPGVTGNLYVDDKEVRKTAKAIVVRDGKFKLWQ